jgi:hypothetical protein
MYMDIPLRFAGDDPRSAVGFARPAISTDVVALPVGDSCALSETRAR